MALIELTQAECRFLAHMLEAPDALFDEEMGFDEDQFEARCWELQAQLAGQPLRAGLHREGLFGARQSGEEDEQGLRLGRDVEGKTHRQAKVANGLEAKLSAALGRPVTIPRS